MSNSSRQTSYGQHAGKQLVTGVFSSHQAFIDSFPAQVDGSRGPELVVFDWDGTIIDSTSWIVTCLQHALHELGLPAVSASKAASVIGLVLPEAARRLAEQISESQVARFIELYRQMYFSRDASLQTFPPMPALLGELHQRGRTLAVATGKSRIGLLRALDHFGWNQAGKKLFASLRCGDDAYPKPHPWMLNDLSEELQVAKTSMVMIGDTTHDLAMAQAAGVKAIALSYGAQSEADLNEFVASTNWHDVPALIAPCLCRDPDELVQLLLKLS